ncbi:hypothetical protein [Pseudoalteromonas sp. MMG024]|uniref:hypothetical protein n=1 Tax=Pseudoalteromonas sp. MMG024 TaxID=2909980 RepID=UPI001F268443|nr:hypothetical protein [Pseudoalteromonas sp. MMG024]MCF6455642.1 hypothetical protein [Pseudoalteromonas sp. MMG024]
MKITNDTMQNRPSNGVDAPTNHGAQLTEQGSRFSHLINEKKQTKYHQINDGLVHKPIENMLEKTTIKQEQRVISHSQLDEFLTSDYDVPKQQQNPIIAAKGVDDNVSAQTGGVNKVTASYQAFESSFSCHELTVACCEGFEHLIIPLEDKTTTHVNTKVGDIAHSTCSVQAQPIVQLLNQNPHSNIKLSDTAFTPKQDNAVETIESRPIFPSKMFELAPHSVVFELASVKASDTRGNINQFDAITLPLQKILTKTQYNNPNVSSVDLLTSANINTVSLIKAPVTNSNAVASQIFMPEPSHGFHGSVLNDIAFSKDVNDLLHNNQLNITVKGELPKTIHWAHAPQKVMPSLEAALENLSDSINEVASSVSLQSTPHALPSVEQVFRAHLKSIDQIHIVENFKSHFAQIDEAILKQSPSLSISLESQYLQGGKVQIDIEQGRLTIHFDVSSSHVLAQLTQSLPDLKLVLNERYPQFNTQFSMNDSDQQRQHQEERDEQAEGEQS